jgi:hypothetical protein
LTFNSNWFVTSKGFPSQGFAPSWATAFPAAPEEIGFAPASMQRPRNDPFPGMLAKIAMLRVSGGIK